MSNEVKLRGEAETVPVEAIHPNGFNPNRQTEAEFEAVKQALLRHGQVLPLVVRWHPDKEGEYQIIDGEHRLRAFRELKVEEVLVWNLGHLEDARAMHLNAVLTETRGANDSQELGKLFGTLIESGMALDEIAVGLPHDPGQVQEIVDYGEYDWKNEYKDAEEPPPVEVPAEESGAETADTRLTFGPFKLTPELAVEVESRFDEVAEANPHLNEDGVFHAAVVAAVVTK